MPCNSPVGSSSLKRPGCCASLQVVPPGAATPTNSAADPWDAYVQSGCGVVLGIPLAPPLTAQAAAHALPLGHGTAAQAAWATPELPTGWQPGEPPFAGPAAPRPAAPPAPQAARSPYNPFVAAARPPLSQQHAVGQLGSGTAAAQPSAAEMLALWQDYRTRLGIKPAGAAEAGGQQWQQQQEGLGDAAQAGPVSKVQEAAQPAEHTPAALPLEDPREEEEEGDMGSCMPARYQHPLLWRPEYAAAEPAGFHRQHAAAGQVAACAGAVDYLALPSLVLISPTVSESETYSSGWSSSDTGNSSSWGGGSSPGADSSDCTPAAIARCGAAFSLLQQDWYTGREAGAALHAVGGWPGALASCATAGLRSAP